MNVYTGKQNSKINDNMKVQNNLKAINTLHIDFYKAKELMYDKCGFNLTELNEEVESQEYGACSFKLNERSIKFRVSKITPTKTGQFVTIWKRNKNGITESFNFSDEIDFVIIVVRSGDNFGQFIFPKSVLADKGIITRDNKEGKRGIRVYPPWDVVANKQAEKTQKWQVEYFFKIAIDNPTKLNQAFVLMINEPNIEI
jgi:hypothetical protein